MSRGESLPQLPSHLPSFHSEHAASRRRRRENPMDVEVSDLIKSNLPVGRGSRLGRGRCDTMLRRLPWSSVQSRRWAPQSTGTCLPCNERCKYALSNSSTPNTVQLTESNVGLSWCHSGILGGALGTKSTAKCSHSRCRIARRTSSLMCASNIRCLSVSHTRVARYEHLVRASAGTEPVSR